jgi:hypothetical protein
MIRKQTVFEQLVVVLLPASLFELYVVVVYAVVQ